MATTVNSILTNLNTYIGDASTDRVSAAERLQYVTEAVVWLQEELGNELQNVVYDLDYFDSVYRYRVTTSMADLLEGADLRRSEQDQTESMSHKSARELAEEIGQGSEESSWSIERYDGQTFMLINHRSKYDAKVVAVGDALDSGGGTWLLDEVNSDATNLTVDVNEFKEPAGSLNFDVDVSQSANNRATLYNDTIDALDLSSYEDLSSWLFWVYLPDVTNFSSVTFYWGESSTEYWSATATTDYNGSAFANGWNRIKINWSSATKTNTPDVASIGYLRVDYNYGVGQGDDTDFRFNDLILCRPEKLRFHYLSWNVGTNSGGTDIVAFTATSDIPFFSGQYDQYKYAVAHKAAAITYQNLRLFDESREEMAEAELSLQRARQLHPSSRSVESKSFKIKGNNLTRHNRRRR